MRLGRSKPEREPEQLTQEQREALADAYGAEMRARPQPTDGVRRDPMTIDPYDQALQDLASEATQARQTRWGPSSARWPRPQPWGVRADLERLMRPWWRDPNIVVPLGGLMLLATSTALSGPIADSQYGKGRAVEYAQQLGYGVVEYTDTDYAPFVGGCPKGSTVKYQLEAENRHGYRVALDVCAGIWNGISLREGRTLHTEPAAPIVDPSVPVAPSSVGHVVTPGN